MLQRVHLGRLAVQGLIVTLFKGKGDRVPFLPSLRELVIIDFSYPLSILSLYGAFMRLVEQGVRSEMLDLRMCNPPPDVHLEDWLRSLSEIVLCPEENHEARERMQAM